MSQRKLALLIALGLAVGACGTRAAREAAVPLDGSAGDTRVGDIYAREPAWDTATPGGSGTPTNSVAPGGAPRPLNGTIGNGTARGAPAEGAIPSPAPAGGRPSTPAPEPGRAPVPSAATAPPAGAVQDTSPIVIGSVGTLSGPAGDVIRRVAEGVQLWVAAVNAKGGLAGHPVKHIVADDGGDPARHKAELRRLVEQENVVALVGNPDARHRLRRRRTTSRSNRVAYIGGDGGGDWFYSTPFHFPQGPMAVTIAEAEIRDVGLYGKAAPQEQARHAELHGGRHLPDLRQGLEREGGRAMGSSPSTGAGPRWCSPTSRPSASPPSDRGWSCSRSASTPTASAAWRRPAPDRGSGPSSGSRPAWPRTASRTIPTSRGPARRCPPSPGCRTTRRRPSSSRTP